MKKLINNNTFNNLVHSAHQANFDSLSFSEENYTLARKNESINESTPILADDKFQVINNEYIIQQQIRPYFGRVDINTKTIASHPDFKHLLISSGMTNHYIFTVFIDIRGSTKLSLKYDLPFVYTFKNAVIKTCIELIRTFDGYVHRIMGDAVLGFFGDSQTSKEEAIINCLNCVAILNVILRDFIQPWLSEQKPDFDVNDFGFRIGCDFGDDHEVLWGNYGYVTTGEISPTGFPVDVAAKLQGLSKKNQIMVGQKLLQFINFPEKFSRIQIRQKDNVDIQCPILSPNYTNKDGEKINYIMRELDYTSYLEGLPIETAVKESFSSKIISNPSIKIISFIKLKNGKNYNFHASEFRVNDMIRVAPKNSIFRIDLQITNDSHLPFPLSVKFTKLNHLGINNEKELEETIYKEDIQHEIVSFNNNRMNPKPFITVSFERDCMYRGIHQVVCEVFDKTKKLIFKDYVNVPIM